MLATIQRMAGDDLHVAQDGYEYRRISGTWQMLGNSGEWFDCDLQCPTVRNQVADFECCLRPYAFAEGPDYPTGRRGNESVGEFIRRIQIAELRAGAKNIFAPVRLEYDASEENRKRFNREYSSARLSRGRAGPTQAAYEAAMKETRKLRAKERRAVRRNVVKPAIEQLPEPFVHSCSLLPEVTLFDAVAA